MPARHGNTHGGVGPGALKEQQHGGFDHVTSGGFERGVGACGGYRGDGDGAVNGRAAPTQGCSCRSGADGGRPGERQGSGRAGCGVALAKRPKVHVSRVCCAGDGMNAVEARSVVCVEAIGVVVGARQVCEEGLEAPLVKKRMVEQQGQHG